MNSWEIPYKRKHYSKHAPRTGAANN